jgi:hypothetical protein
MITIQNLLRLLSELVALLWAMLLIHSAFADISW